MNQIPNIEEWKDSHKGKLWSTAVQKCFEAPFPEVAIQHLLMRIDEKHQHQLQKARQEGYKLAVKHLKEAYAANGATTVPEAIEWLEDNSRYQAELN